MRSLLLDSHTLLWALGDDYSTKLSSAVQEAILSPENLIHYSIVSLWELKLKESKTKHLPHPFKLPDNFYAVLDSKDYQCLTVNRTHIDQSSTLPFHHKDPFDRMLIAQAQMEKMTLISKDSFFTHYDVKLLSW